MDNKQRLLIIQVLHKINKFCNRECVILDIEIKKIGTP